MSIMFEFHNCLATGLEPPAQSPLSSETIFGVGDYQREQAKVLRKCLTMPTQQRLLPGNPVSILLRIVQSAKFNKAGQNA
jgi:hypothetical protein